MLKTQNPPLQIRVKIETSSSLLTFIRDQSVLTNMSIITGFGQSSNPGGGFGGGFGSGQSLSLAPSYYSLPRLRLSEQSVALHFGGLMLSIEHMSKEVDFIKLSSHYSLILTLLH